MSLRSQLQAIHDEHGQLTAALVVDAARPEKHLLHNHFEWDDKVAGELHRRDHAAALIRSVKVVYTDDDADPKTVREWVSVRPDDRHQGTYRPVAEVMADEFNRQLVLRQMERDWKALRRRHAHMQEFADMVRRDLEDGAA